MIPFIWNSKSKSGTMALGTEDRIVGTQRWWLGTPAGRKREGGFHGAGHVWLIMKLLLAVHIFLVHFLVIQYTSRLLKICKTRGPPIQNNSQNKANIKQSKKLQRCAPLCWELHFLRYSDGWHSTSLSQSTYCTALLCLSGYIFGTLDEPGNFS